MKRGRTLKTACAFGLVGAAVTFFVVVVPLSITVRYSSDERINIADAKIERVDVENSLFQSVFDYSIESNLRHSVRFYIDFVGNVEPHRLIEKWARYNN